MAMYSSVLNVGRRRSRTDEKLEIFEARLLRRSRSHLDNVKAIRVRSKIFCQNRYRQNIQGESGDAKHGQESSDIDSLSDSELNEGRKKECIRMTDDTKSDITDKSNNEEKVEESKQVKHDDIVNTNKESAELSQDTNDVNREVTDDKVVRNDVDEVFHDISSISLGEKPTSLDQQNMQNEGKIPGAILD